MLVALASPGLYDSINYDSFKNLDNITIEYKTEHFSLNDIYMVIIPKLIDKEDFKVFDKMDTLYESTKKLPSSMNELQNGTKKLSKGAKKLSSGAEEISNNIKEVSNAINELNNGSYNINQGLNKVLKALEKAEASLNSNDQTSKAEQLSYLKSQNQTAINKLIKKTGLSYEQLQSYYVKNNLANYNGDDEQLLSIKNAYELVYLLYSNNNAIDSTLETLSQTSQQVNKMLTSLKTNLVKITNGSSSLNQGLTKLETGVNKLYNGSLILKSGANSLNNGTNTLSQGMNKFNEQGISKLSKSAEVLKNKKNIAEELITLSKNYKGYASNNKDESTFIYKLDALK